MTEAHGHASSVSCATFTEIDIADLISGGGAASDWYLRLVR